VHFDLAAAGTAFGLIFLAELPDKTMFASLAMGTRMRPPFVWIGATAAFAVHVAIAVGAGSLLSLLPNTAVKLVSAALFAFVCWGIWALSGGGSLATSVIVFIVTLLVAVGVFCLARVVGYYVLERTLHRQRRSARGSHLVTALFLAGVGVTDLQQTEWVMTAYHWVANHVS